MVLGGGPNRIGQGIEFDYCCVHAALALREDGYETIMVNCNPETVSTDYDTSDRLYFEPLTLEDVLEIVDMEKPKGVIVQFGGQTPLKLARRSRPPACRSSAPRPTRSTRRGPRALPAAAREAGPAAAAEPHRAQREAGARRAEEIGYPLMVRPSYVLGGRAMEIVHEQPDLERYMREAVQGVATTRRCCSTASSPTPSRSTSTRLRRQEPSVIGGVMEHIEEAGMHSGDSACSLPPYSLSAGMDAELKRQTRMMAHELERRRPDERAVRDPESDTADASVYVLEVNPRASRTVPFVSKATGLQLAKIAARCMAGQTLDAQGVDDEVVPAYYSVKEAVFPFVEVPRRRHHPRAGDEVDRRGDGRRHDLRRSVRQVAARRRHRCRRRTASTARAGQGLHQREERRQAEGGRRRARALSAMGFPLLATRGTAAAIVAAGIAVRQRQQGGRGAAAHRRHRQERRRSRWWSTRSRRSATRSPTRARSARRRSRSGCTQYTTIAGARAAVEGMRLMHERGDEISVFDLQGLHRALD